MKWLLIVLIWVFTFNVSAQDEFLVFKTNNGHNPVWEAHKNAPSYLYNHLSSHAIELLDNRKKQIDDINTIDEWKEYQIGIKEKLSEIFGPFPEKTPLNAKITRIIKKEGYSVEHIVYESILGYKVTSSLFIPSGTKGKKVPTILYCSGHYPNAYRCERYQHIILNLVMKGFIVFAFDPAGQGERIQYYNRSENKSLFSHPVKEHSYSGAQVFLNGMSVAKYFVWDGIRAIDYLLTRKEVDPERIGITGHSGGGAQAAYIAALDDRIFAAAPECWITNCKRLLQSIGPQDAEQNLYHFIHKGLDLPDFLILRAPKPAMMITTTNDFFSIQGAMEAEEEISTVYRAFKKHENFRREEGFGRHQTITMQNKEALYAFFQEHLDNAGVPDDKEVNYLTKAELQVTSTGQLATSTGSETIYSLNKKEAEKLLSKLDNSRTDLNQHLPRVITSAKKITAYKNPDNIKNPVLTGKYKKDGFIIEKFFVQGSKGYVIPFVYFIPDGTINKVLIYIHPNGKMADNASHMEMEWFTKQGFAVLVPDLLGTGETFPSGHKGDAFIDSISLNIWFTSILANKSIAGIRTEDITRLIKLAEMRFGSKDIYALAKGEMASVLLHAAAFNEEIKKVALVQPYSSYSSIILNKYYDLQYIYNGVPGAIREYDLPDLAACLAPRDLLMININDGTGNLLEKDQLKKELAIIRSAYLMSNAENQLIIQNRRSEVDYFEMYKVWIGAMD